MSPDQAKKSASDSKQVVYFDGVCNLCNAFVDWLMRRDHKRKLYFSSLQSETARTRLPVGMADSLSSVVFESGGKVYRRSEAALRVMAALGGVHSLWLGFLIVPGFIRDPIYGFIARNRYRWFGQRDTCRLPSPEEKSRFL